MPVLHVAYNIVMEGKLRFFFGIVVLVEDMLGPFWGHLGTIFGPKVILGRPRGTLCDVSRAGAALEALLECFGGSFVALL